MTWYFDAKKNLKNENKKQILADNTHQFDNRRITMI